VGVGRVDIRDPQVDGAAEGLEGLLLVLVHQEPAAGAEAEGGDCDPRLAEGTGGNLGRVAGAEARGGRGTGGGRAEELTPGEVHGCSSRSKVGTARDHIRAARPGRGPTPIRAPPPAPV